MFFSVSPAMARMVDRIVAEVNGDIITLSELNEEGTVYLNTISERVTAANRERALNKALNQILDGLIDKTLIAQAAAKRKISVSDKEIEDAVQRIMTTNNVTITELEKDLKKSGIDLRTYKKNLKSQLLQNKLVTREVHSKIVITEDMILDYYDTEYTSHVAEGDYYLLQIGTSWGNTEDSQKSNASLYEDKMNARKQAVRIHELAKNGQDFRTLAKKFSDLPSAPDGGDIGVFSEDEMSSYMKEAVIHLKPGEISPIVETPAGFQFFKLLSSKEGGVVMQVPYESVKEEIRETLFQKSLETEFQKWINTLKKSSYIKKML